MTSSLSGLAGAAGVPTNPAAALAAAGYPSNTQQLLTSAGISQDNMQAAVTSLTGLDSGTQNAVLNLANQVANTKSFSFNNVADLVAAGFAASGVGVPIAAAITIGLPLVEGLINALNPTPQYAWIYRPPNYGTPAPDNFTMGAKLGSKAPYGPTDPNWLTFEKMAPQLSDDIGAMAKIGFGFQNASLDWVVPGLNAQYAEWNNGKTDGGNLYGVPAAANTFRQIYNAAWRKNYEFILNGHGWADPYTLLTTIAMAWNATHKSTSTVTLTKSMAPSYISHLINGDYDGQDHPPVVINTGAAIPAKPGPSLTSAAKQAAVVQHVITLKLPAQRQIAASLVSPWWSWWLPALPAAAGGGLYPWFGWIAPGVGAGVSTLWYMLKKWG